MADMISRNASGHSAAVTSYEAPLPTTTNNTEKDSGYDLPADGVVLDCILAVDTAATSTAKTMDIGTLSSESGGDADGFCDGISGAATGLIVPTLADGAATRGALMRVDESAGDLVPEPYDVTEQTARSISLTSGDAAGLTNFVGRFVALMYRDPGAVAT